MIAICEIGTKTSEKPNSTGDKGQNVLLGGLESSEVPCVPAMDGPASSM
jgi:hypothetical protein